MNHLPKFWLPWNGYERTTRFTEMYRAVKINSDWVDDGDWVDANTEVPNDEDEYINSVEDENTRREIRWCKYLVRLKLTAWGDHIAVQGLADMLHVDIHIVSTINPDMEPVKTSHHTYYGVNKKPQIQ